MECQLLTSEGRVASNTVDERAEDGADTDTSASETNGGGTSTVNLGSSDDGGGSRLDDDASGLHHTTHHVGGEVLAGAIEEQAVADSGLLAYRADDGAWDGSYGSNCVNKTRLRAPARADDEGGNFTYLATSTWDAKAASCPYGRRLQSSCLTRTSW